MFGLKLFLALCSVVIDYCLILINYMLWFMDSFGFVFYFNRLQRPLGGGGFLAYLIDYLYQLLVLGENKGKFN